ncbi:lysophospholipid acyltransferase family protein [Desulfofustis limnaeus]|jgi:predicted LPLAT superfamily acyltransferase|uniref:Lauroyl acyltransferase n=1 Tax=Desulfofustis limnaeus TaxID=2740163 RepID=A0ABN6M097_9BACT|nr:lysophospholipid acyltransferase family protein [Desulfofustis limnaeus]MDX9896025.1 lysophospholipid acyltransferase family protein [Desulfofustis sp.]BDD86306.1 hypothetical protein DPPLL_06710 [Desulfofustis limnaeus]
MSGWFYRLLCLSGRVFGARLFALVARVVAVGYFLFSPRAGESRRFYAQLFPGKGWWFYQWCTFRQYQSFTTIHLDRFLRNRLGRPVSFTSTGWEKLTATLGGSGGILLMSHLGNWEMAAHLLRERQRHLPVVLYMGIKEREAIEGEQKEDLRRAGITIVGVERGAASPYSLVEGIACLRAGGIVSLAGDLLWSDQQRQVEVAFLGGRAYLPSTPYILALLTRAPLFAFFSFRRGPNSYDFSLSEPLSVQCRDRRERDEAIDRAAQHYADLLIEALRQHPFEWYHFERFLH